VVVERPATPIGPIGFVLPTFPQELPLPGAPTTDRPATDFDPIRALASICSDAEKLGAGALWACDHLFWHGPTLECLTTLTLAATATEQAALGTCVLQLPLRLPTVVAKQVATLQTLSRGRFILGVGVGLHPEEYEQAGVDYHTRGLQLDAGIIELRRSWSAQHEPRHDGPVQWSPYRQLPEPPAVPVWIGGSSVAARKRAARVGDGWLPLFVEPDRYRHDLDQLAEDVASGGRAPGSVTPAIVLFVSVDDHPGTALRRGTRWMSSMYKIPPKAFERHLVSGTAAEVADRVAAYHDAGAEHVALYVTDDRPLDQFETLVGALSAAGVPSPA
jgi:alkanesulfonate monooxygenase SsuD/methylene tetrahydromethanopterin reductase-like flavin-dependent oxidoreductase (luciferase family)